MKTQVAHITWKQQPTDRVNDHGKNITKHYLPATFELQMRS